VCVRACAHARTRTRVFVYLDLWCVKRKYEYLHNISELMCHPHLSLNRPHGLTAGPIAGHMQYDLA
jgi:hypothetical protein